MVRTSLPDPVRLQMSPRWVGLHFGFAFVQYSNMIHPLLRFSARGRLASFAVLSALLAAVSPLKAETGRIVHLTVTDPLNRFVAGLDREYFEAVEGGVGRSIAVFSSADSPMYRRRTLASLAVPTT